MSDDDFFTDKDSTLHYIHSKSSTKIDDILKRRQWKKLKEGTELKSDSFLSAEENWNRTESGQKIWSHNNIDNNTNTTATNDNVIDRYYNKREEYIPGTTDYEKSIFLKNGEKGKSTYFSAENVDTKGVNDVEREIYGDDDVENRYGKKRSIQGERILYNGEKKIEEKIEKKPFSLNDEEINEMQNFVASRKAGLDEKRVNNGEFEKQNNYSYAKLRSNVTSYNSIVSENNETKNIPRRSSSRINSSNSIRNLKDDEGGNFLINKEAEHVPKYRDVLRANTNEINRNEVNRNEINTNEINRNEINTNGIEREDTLFFRKKIELFKTPSTELLLNKMKSNEEEDKQEEPFINLNKFSVSNEIDMNKTPTKSYSQSYSKQYAEYVKFETAGKMNMSELETPHYLKEEEHGNTPLLAYYLAGKGQEEYIENDVPVEDANMVNENGDIQTDHKITPSAKKLEANNTSAYGNHYKEYEGDIRTFGSVIEYAKTHSKETKELEELKPLKGYEQINFSTGKNENRPITVNENVSNIHETASTASNKTNNKYYDEDIYKKINSSKKYNFLKTEEEYDEILKKKKTTMRNDSNSENKANVSGFGNEISFTDKRFSIAPFNVMNSRAFKKNFLNDLKTNNYESNLYFSNLRGDTKIYGRENSALVEQSFIEPHTHIDTETGAHISRTFSHITPNATLYKNVEKENEQTLATAPGLYNIEKSAISRNSFPSFLISKTDKQKSVEVIEPGFRRNSFDKRSENGLDIGMGYRNDEPYTNRNSFFVQKRSKSFSENSRVLRNEEKRKNSDVLPPMKKEDIILSFSKTEGTFEPLLKSSDYNRTCSTYKTVYETEKERDIRRQSLENELTGDTGIIQRDTSNEMSPEYKNFLSVIQGTYVNVDEEKEFERKGEQKNDAYEDARERETEKETKLEKEAISEKEAILEKEGMTSSFVNYETRRSHNRSIVNGSNQREWKEEDERTNEKNFIEKNTNTNTNADTSTSTGRGSNANTNTNANKAITSTYFNVFRNEESLLKPPSRGAFNSLCETADFGRKEIVNQSVESSLKTSEDVANTSVKREQKLYDRIEGSFVKDINGTKDSSFDSTKHKLRKIDTNDIKKMILNSYSVSGHNLDIPFEIVQKELQSNDDINEYIKEQIRNGVNAVIEKILTDKEKEIEEKLEQSISQKREKKKTEKTERTGKTKKAEKTEEEAKCKKQESLSNGSLQKIDEYSTENENSGYTTEGKNKKEVLSHSINNDSPYYEDENMNGESISVRNIRKSYEGYEKNSEKSNSSSTRKVKEVERKKKKKDLPNGTDTVKIQNEFDEEDMREINTLNEKLKMNKITKLIEINKKDLERQNVNVKKVMYNCIDVIYHLLNEHKKKNNKLNSLMNEIENLNEYEKRIEKLTNENKHLKKEVELKNEQFQKKEMKEKATLNKKITEQANKISTYEKDMIIYKNKVNKLNNKIGNKEKEIEKLKSQYETILEEVESCKTAANKIVKQILNKKNINFVEKQYLDIAKYYEIQMHSLTKEIKNIKDLMKKETKEKILLVKRLKELEELKKEQKKEDKEMENERTEKSENNITNVSDVAHFKKMEPLLGELDGTENTKETDKEETYKTKYHNLFKEMKEIKKDLEEQKRLYDEKINHLEQTQEMQNMKNQLNATEKIVQLYQSVFKEKVNNISNGGLGLGAGTGTRTGTGGELANGMLGLLPNENKEHAKNDGSFLHYSDYLENVSQNKPYGRQYSSRSIPGDLNHIERNNRGESRNNMDNIFLDNDQFHTSGAHGMNENSICQNGVFYNSLFGIHKSTSAMNKSGGLFSSKRRLANSQLQNLAEYPNHLIDISSSINMNMLKDFKNINYEQCLNDFVKLYIEHAPTNDKCHLRTETDTFQRSERNVDSSQNCFVYDPSQNELLYKNLRNYEKEKLIELFINICNDLRIDNIFVIVQFVKFLSFIVYEQFPLFTSFYYTIASMVSIKSIQFNKCIEIVKRWKMYYAHGKKLYYFRKSVLLIFKSDLQNVKKEMIDETCVNLIKSIYSKHSEVDNFSKDSYEKAEYIINKHAKELISRIIKTYMNIYNVEKISSIIAHMNSMHAKFKAQSYFVRSVSTCLNLNKTDNLQEIEDKIKDLISSKEIGEKLKNKIKIEDVEEYLAAYTILNTLKKYLNISQTKDLLPSISKIIQQNRSFHL